MKKVILVLVCAWTFFGFAATSQAEIKGKPKDIAAIDAILDDNVVALNKHDPVGASKQYTTDCEFTNVAGIHVKGRAEIEKFLRAGFATRLKDVTWKSVDRQISFIRPDVAIVHSTAEITGFTEPNGTVEPPHNELSIRVFVRDKGVWNVAAFHNTTVVATLKRN
jgi:uncharacterized protein (TIGR02246 family)